MKISVQELLIVLAIVILIFGPSQIPKLIKIFKKSTASLREGLEEDEEAEDLDAKSKKASKKSAVKDAEARDEQ